VASRVFASQKTGRDGASWAYLAPDPRTPGKGNVFLPVGLAAESERNYWEHSRMFCLARNASEPAASLARRLTAAEMAEQNGVFSQ